MATARWRQQCIAVLAVAGLVLLATGCSTTQGQPVSQQTPTTATGPTAYTPRTRDFTVTAAPLLVHEMQDMLPYLKKGFAKGGLLDGKEIYGFFPNTLVVYQGDTVQVTLVNPVDDAHTFTIPDLGVNVALTSQSSTQTSFVANNIGVFTFLCEVPEHTPYQRGQLVVLPDSDAPRA